MKKVFTLLCVYSLLTACATKADIPEGQTACVEPRPEVCTMNYMPVCATQNTEEYKTYSNACSACADSKVVSYAEHACKK